MMSVMVLAATDAYVSWDANPLSENVYKYVVYMAKSPATNFTAAITVTNGTAGIVRGITPGFYSFFVTAFNTQNVQSAPSNVISTNVANVSAPLNFRFTQ